MSLNPLAKLYKNGEHFVLQDDETKLFHTCDVEGVADPDEMYHVGDSYRTLEEATIMADFWENGGHWKDRPDISIDGETYRCVTRNVGQVAKYG